MAPSARIVVCSSDACLVRQSAGLPSQNTVSGWSTGKTSSLITIFSLSLRTTTKSTDSLASMLNKRCEIDKISGTYYCCKFEPLSPTYLAATFHDIDSNFVTAVVDAPPSSPLAEE